MAPPLMAAIHSSNQKNHHKGRYISATALPGCHRKLMLERTVDYAEYFHNLYYAFRGTMTHTVVENASSVDLGNGKDLAEMGFLTEWRMLIGFCFEHGAFSVPDDTDVDDVATFAQLSCPECDRRGVPSREQRWFLLGGTLDSTGALWHLFDAETGILPCRLYDIKTMQEYAINFMIKGDAKNTYHPQIKDDYIKQANVYKYLAERCTPPEVLRKQGVRRLQFVDGHIQGFAMGTAPWTGGGTFQWKDHYKHDLKNWEMLPIKFFDDEWIEDYIRTNGQGIYDSLIMETQRAQVCEPDENSKGLHNWKCGYCAFFGSDDCPNPRLEWTLMNRDGLSPKKAFAAAINEPAEMREEYIGKIDSKDRSNMTDFFKNATGPLACEIPEWFLNRGPDLPVPEKPKKRRKPRATKIVTINESEEDDAAA